MRHLLTTTILFFSATILGCSQNSDGEIELTLAPTLTNKACTKASPRHRRESQRWMPALEPDKKFENGVPYVSKGKLREREDAYELAEYRKNRALKAVIEQLDECVDGTKPTPLKPMVTS